MRLAPVNMVSFSQPAEMYNKSWYWQKIDRTTTTADKLRHQALAKTGKDAVLYFSLHFDNKSNPKGVVRGDLSSNTGVKCYASILYISTKSACTSCRSTGLEACEIPWDEAVLKGHLKAFVDTDKSQASVKLWLAARMGG